MNEENEQHNAQIRGSLSQIAIALSHLWLTNCYVQRNQLPNPTTFWVYPNSFALPWGYALLKGKRIRVHIEIEDWPKL